MRAPTLRQVEGDLARIAAMAPKLAEAARWAWPMAWERHHGDQPRVSHDVSRPVEAVVTDMGLALVRQNVAHAGVLIGRAAEALLIAAGDLQRAQALADSGPATPPAPEGAPLVSKAELAEARAAKARREGRRPRGVGHGEY